MESDPALEQLPAAYAAALRLRDAGFDEHAIAQDLGMPQESVASLLTLAEAKLDRAIRSRPDHAPEQAREE